jgi:hypothetical protein
MDTRDEIAALVWAMANRMADDDEVLLADEYVPNARSALAGLCEHLEITPEDLIAAARRQSSRNVPREDG